MENNKKLQATKKQLSPYEREAFKRNYSKLWIKEKVNFPFIIRVAAIQKPRGLPVKGSSDKLEENLKDFFRKIKKEEETFFNSQEFLQLVPLINDISKLKLPVDKAKQASEYLFGDKFPWPKFQGEIKSLAKDFGFDERWIPYLTNYVLTGEITAPHDRIDNDAPPENIIQDWKIFLLVSKKKAQHDFLKKQGYKSASRARGAGEKLRSSYISDLQDTAGKILPYALIHDYLEIGLMVWGDDEEADLHELGKLDKRKTDRVKKRLERFVKAYCVSATDDDIALLQSLPKTT